MAIAEQACKWDLEDWSVHLNRNVKKIFSRFGIALNMQGILSWIEEFFGWVAVILEMQDKALFG
jgi:hypothetical protein